MSKLHQTIPQTFSVGQFPYKRNGKQRKKGGRARSNGYFLPPHSVLIFAKKDLKGPLHYIIFPPSKNMKSSLTAYLTSRNVCKTLDGIL